MEKMSDNKHLHSFLILDHEYGVSYKFNRYCYIVRTPVTVTSKVGQVVTVTVLSCVIFDVDSK